MEGILPEDGTVVPKHVRDTLSIYVHNSYKMSGCKNLVLEMSVLSFFGCWLKKGFNMAFACTSDYTFYWKRYWVMICCVHRAQ
jgi:hypothetical protein